MRELSDSFWDEIPLAQANTNADSGVWGYSADDLARMKRQEQAKKWGEQYNDVAEKMQTSFADAPKFTAQQINAASAGLRQQAYTGLSAKKEGAPKGLSPTDNWSTEGAAYEKTDDEELTPSQAVEKYRYLIKKYMATNQMDDETMQKFRQGYQTLAYYVFQYDRIPADSRDPAITQELANNADEVAGYLSDMINSISTKKEPEITPAEAENAYWRYRNGISLPGDEKYSRYFPSLANTYEDKEKPGMWGLTERQLDEVSLKRRKEIEEGSKPNISFEDNTPRTPSENVERYRKLTQQHIENPDMDQITRQALIKELQKGFELLSYYVCQYDNFEPPARDPAITNQLANEAQNVLDFMSDNLWINRRIVSDIANNDVAKNAKDFTGIIGDAVSTLEGLTRIGKALSFVPAILLLGADYYDAASKDNWDFGGKKALGTLGRGLGEIAGGFLGGLIFVGAGIGTGGIGLAAAAIFGGLIGSITFASTGEALGVWLSDII